MDKETRERFDKLFDLHGKTHTQVTEIGRDLKYVCKTLNGHEGRINTLETDQAGLRATVKARVGTSPGLVAPQTMIQRHGRGAGVATVTIATLAAIAKLVEMLVQ